MNFQANHMPHAVQADRGIVISVIIQVLEHMENAHFLAPRGGSEPDVPVAFVQLVSRGFFLRVQIIELQA